MTDDRDAVTPPQAGTGTDTGTLMNIARGAKGIALLCFLLPWVTVSCAGQPLAQMSGIGMATGKINVLADQGALSGLGQPQANPLTNFASTARPDLLILAAAILIVAGLVLSFVLARRSAAIAGMATAVAAAVLIGFEVLIRIPGAVAGQARQGAPAGGAATSEFERSMQQQMEHIAQSISATPQIGFWLTLLALIAAAILFKIVHGRRVAVF